MTMCYHPWVGLDISPQGEFKPCCKYRDVLGTSFEEYDASPALAELRADFQAGRKNAACARCWQDEDAGLPSKRTLDNEYTFKGEEPDMGHLKVLSFPFGNTCNLACRICSSYPSSRWGKEAKKLIPHFPDIKIWGHNKFYQDPEFMKKLKSRVRNVIHLDIPGGEPFYADYQIHYDFIKNLINYRPENITLHYTTNGTQLPDKQYQSLWRAFKQVEIQVSVDGFGPQFEYNRWPAKFHEVSHNLAVYRELAKTRDNFKLSISHSVSIFTLYGLPEFMTWCTKNELPDPYLGLVSNPLHYSITILPRDSKVKIAKHLLQNQKLAGIARAMMARDDSTELDNFIKYVKILDTQRQQSFVDTFPEIYQLLGDQCQTLYQLY